MKYPVSHLALSLGIGILVLIGYGVWYRTVAAESARLADLESQIALKTETENRIVSARATLANLKEDESAVQRYFVSEAAVVDFIKYLEARGALQRAVVRVLSVSLVTTSASQRATLTFSLSVEGAFASVMRTIGSIEYAPYDLSVNSLALSREEAGHWRANLTLAVGSVPPAPAGATKP